MIFGIYRYLKDYLYWIRNVKLVECNDYIKTRQECVDKLLKVYTKKYPERSCIQTGGHPVLRGGNEYVELNKIYNMIQSIDPSKIKNISSSSQELDELIKKLQTKIKEVASVEATANTSGLVQNSIETMKVGLQRFGDVDKIKVSKLEKTLPNELLSEFSPIVFEEELSKMKEKLKQLSGDKTDVSQFADVVKKMDIEVIKRIEEYKAKMELIKKAIGEMSGRICALNGSTKYDAEIELKKIVYVPEFRWKNSFLEELQKINDPELNKFLENIVPKLLELGDDKRTFKINLRDAIQLFNDSVAPYTHIIREKTKYKSFLKFYDGENNTRINNKFFSKEGLVDINMINDMIFDPKFSLENVHKDLTNFPTEYIKKLEAREPSSIATQTDIEPVKAKKAEVIKSSKQVATQTTIAKSQQAKKFDAPISQRVVKQTVVSSPTRTIAKPIPVSPPKLPPKPILKGGDNDLGISTQVYEEFAGTLNQYNLLANKYNDVLSLLNSTLIDHFMHNVFLVAIATNQLIIPGYVIHEYIQRGALALYRRIINNLMDDVENNPMKVHCIYMRKYHTVTLKILQSFVNKVTIELNRLKLENKRDFVIDINSCTGSTRTGFLLLNHFKELLMQYNALAGSKVTIYGRINDLGRPADPSIESDLKTMSYMSGFDLELAKEFMKKEYAEEQQTKTELVTSAKPKLIACANEEIMSDLQSGPDVRKMWVNPLTCKCPSNSSGLDFDKQMKPIKFTEMFDSNQYPKSDDISKYMQVETLLAQGRGVGMMTYGYSGTGKTFTLFGNSANNISGILQSTLADVNGLRAVYFRAFELYGLGMPYPHYWMKDLDKCIGKTGCLPNILHYICHYNTYLDNDKGLMLESKPDPNNDNKPSLDTRKKPDVFQEYVNDRTKTYCPIPENMIAKTFKIFENYIEAVDKQRVATKRIRDTPNNPVSSRSVVIYDFQLEVYGQEKKVPFLIVDLPGREEILQSFVEPYLNSEIVKRILTEAKAYNDRLKLTLAFACINPLGLATVEADLILDEIKKMNSADRDKLIGERYIEMPIGKIDMVGLKSKIVAEQSNPIREIKDLYSSIYKKITANSVSVVDNKLVGSVKLLEEFINMEGGILGKWFIYDDKKGTFELHAKHTGFGYQVDEQFKIVLCMHLINRMILDNRFDLIHNIFERISNEKINNYLDAYVDKLDTSGLKSLVEELVSTNFKLVFWRDKVYTRATAEKPSAIKQEFLDNIEKFKEVVKQILHYDYIDAPYEGFYINENIIGLIKYLAQTAKDDETFVKKQIPKQNPLLDFTFQRNKIRIMEITGNIPAESIKQKFIWNDKMDVPDENDASVTIKVDMPLPQSMFDVNGSKLMLIPEAIKPIYEDMRSSYRAERIFNYDYPVIGTILAPYLESIFDYKVLYLLANYKDDKIRCSRCEHQFKLLTKTIGFIDAIAS